MLKRGVTIWNYPGDALDNARTFFKLGFDAVSWLGQHFDRLDEASGAALAAFLRETGMTLTVHHILPDPENAEHCAAFEQGVVRMRDWQGRYGLMAGLTFDSWFDIHRTMPYLRLALDAFQGCGVFLACEDTPLNSRSMESYAKMLGPKDDFGILIDVGHLNVRQYLMERHDPEDFVRMFEDLPLPVREVHLHDNKGRKDDHSYFGFGNLPLDGVVRGLKNIGFDGVVSVEIIQRDWPPAQGFQYAKDTSDAFFTRWARP
ncbi:MAG TPA: TIM barrel protein [Clostridia bacterium]|nr:TIM barrel protein [Clostridia bacterium]